MLRRRQHQYDLQDNVQDFNRLLNEAMERLPQHANTIKRKMALEVLGRVARRSPVDTGRFRGNWQVGINRRPTGEVGVGGAAAAAPAAIAQGATQLAIVQPGQDIWITNNVPYAEQLEFGSSWQAPEGVLAVTLAEVREGMLPLA